MANLARIPVLTAPRRGPCALVSGTAAVPDIRQFQLWRAHAPLLFAASDWLVFYHLQLDQIASIRPEVKFFKSSIRLYLGSFMAVGSGGRTLDSLKPANNSPNGELSRSR